MIDYWYGFLRFVTNPSTYVIFTVGFCILLALDIYQKDWFFAWWNLGLALFSIFMVHTTINFRREER